MSGGSLAGRFRALFLPFPGFSTHPRLGLSDRVRGPVPTTPRHRTFDMASHFRSSPSGVRPTLFLVVDDVQRAHPAERPARAAQVHGNGHDVIAVGVSAASDAYNFSENFLEKPADSQRRQRG